MAVQQPVLRVSNICPDEVANLAYVNPDDFEMLKREGLRSRTLDVPALVGLHLELAKCVLMIQPSPSVPTGRIGLSAIARIYNSYAVGDSVLVRFYTPAGAASFVRSARVEVDFLQKKAQVAERFNASDLADCLRSACQQHTLSIGQRIPLLIYHRYRIVFSIVSITVGDVDGKVMSPQKTGIMAPDAQMFITKQQGSLMNLVESGAPDGSEDVEALAAATPALFRTFNFEELGIGGMNQQMSQIFRKAFLSRLLPRAHARKIGLRPCRGILLYGPPGTGKTLIARKIGQMLNGREPKRIAGPEIFNKYVGASEAAIRDLFKEAEIEQKEKGDQSGLHIIIMDEIDSICKRRGSSGDSTNVADNVVNQLLSKLDGTDPLNNILVIGMTNRIDLLDPAILRPGRFDLHVEIGLPDEKGRLDILRIHTKNMRENCVMSKEVNLERMAKLTKNFTGAELEDLVCDASTYALYRHVEMDKVQEGIKHLDTLAVTPDDFEAALHTAHPAFGSEDDSLRSVESNIEGSLFAQLLADIDVVLTQAKRTTTTRLLPILLHGPRGCGKSTLATLLAARSEMPYALSTSADDPAKYKFRFAKVVSPQQLVGLSETARCARLVQVFEDAYKSVSSVIVVDDIEKLIDYAPIGPRFSNVLLQTLSALLNRKPPKNHKLLVIATTSSVEVLNALQLRENFAHHFEIAALTHSEFSALLRREAVTFSAPQQQALQTAYPTHGVPIKRVLGALDTAKYSSSAADAFEILKKSFQT